MQIIDGKKIRDEILAEVKNEVARLSFRPVFCDVLVGNDPGSVQYVQMKSRKAESVGIKFYNASFPNSITTEELVKEIEKINKIPNMCGIIVQLPLPESIDKKKILDTINPELDVDCLGAKRSSEFYTGKTDFGFPTALACARLLDSVGVNLGNKDIVILGKGELVGRPVSALLNFRGLSHTVIDSKSDNKEEIIKKADVIISGMGNGKYITGDMIKNGAILIDAGTSESLERSSTGEIGGSIVGDVDFDSVKDVAGFLSPVPGGVGPVTVAMLFNNVLNVAKLKKVGPSPSAQEPTFFKKII